MSNHSFSRPEWGWAHTGKGDLWLRWASPRMPGLHLTCVPQTQPLVPFPPGSQVQRRKCAAVDKVLRELVGHEDIVLGHGGDACVVADDAGQGDIGQGPLLLCAEHILVLPPKPAWEHPRTSYPRLCWTGRASPGM